MNLDQQVVVVTGAAQGIGRAIALAFAAEGSKVIVNDVNGEGAQQTAAEIVSNGGQAVAIRADIAEPGAVRAMFERACDTFGHVTTLINNAGYQHFKPLLDHTPEAWNKVLSIDLSGAFHCAQAAIPHMVAAGGGFIVNIASVHAQRTLPTSPAYAAAKAGIVAFTHSLALEFGPKNIRVNCVSPGAIETDALRAYLDSLPPERRESELQYLLSWHPLGRLGRPQDIADVVVFLCSPKAQFIHGAEITADGGLTARLF